MTEAATRDRIHELHAVAIQWMAKANRAADDGHHFDAQQHARRSNECVYAARKLEETLKP